MSGNNIKFQTVTKTTPVLPEPTRIQKLVQKASGGLVTTVQQANIVLLVILVSAIVIMIVLFRDQTRPIESTIIIAPGETVGSDQGMPQ